MKYILLMLLFPMCLVSAKAQSNPDFQALKGTWVINAINQKILDQQNSSLLEENHYTSLDSMYRVNAYFPVEMNFANEALVLRDRFGTLRTGSCNVSAGVITQYEQQDDGLSNGDVPVQLTTLNYTVTNGTLTITSKSFYKDYQRNRAVVSVITTYYQKTE